MPISLKVINHYAAALCFACCGAVPAPIVQLDAAARASGTRKPVAIQVARSLLRTRWPAQVLKIYADGFGTHTVVGLRISGEHFHVALNRAAFVAEVGALVAQTFAAAAVEEVDVWASVPLSVGKGVVVAGDLAQPTSRTVFSASVGREESPASFLSRLRSGSGTFWDQDWARHYLK